MPLWSIHGFFRLFYGYKYSFLRTERYVQIKHSFKSKSFIYMFVCHKYREFCCIQNNIPGDFVWKLSCLLKTFRICILQILYVLNVCEKVDALLYGEFKIEMSTGDEAVRQFKLESVFSWTIKNGSTFKLFWENVWGMCVKFSPSNCSTKGEWAWGAAN